MGHFLCDKWNIGAGAVILQKRWYHKDLKKIYNKEIFYHLCNIRTSQASLQCSNQRVVFYYTYMKKNFAKPYSFTPRNYSNFIVAWNDYER